MVVALNARRLGLIDAAAAAQFSEELEDFLDLANDLRDFLRDVGQVFPTPQFRDATEALALVWNCISLLVNAVISGPGLTVAASNCEASSRSAAEGLSTPLVGVEERDRPADTQRAARGPQHHAAGEIHGPIGVSPDRPPGNAPRYRPGV